MTAIWNSAIATLLATISLAALPAQAQTAPAKPTRMELFAQNASGQLEPLVTGALVKPGAKLRVRVESPSAATATVKLSSGSTNKTVVDAAPVKAGTRQILPGELPLSGLTGDVLVQVQLSGGATASSKSEWRLHIPAEMGATLAVSDIKAASTSAAPGDTLGVSFEALNDRPTPDLLSRLALRGLDSERTRGPQDVALFRQWSPGVILVTTPGSIGSGAIIDRKNRIAVTNMHVVRGRSTVNVVFKPKDDSDVANAQAYQADVIKVDEVSDLALLRIREIPDHVPEIRLGSLSDVPIGSDVHAIGHPTGELWTYTKGIVSQVRRGYEWRGSAADPAHTATVIQTQTPINPGNSGGPLLDDKGLLVGINSFRRADAEGINYAVSVDDIRALMALQASRRFPGGAQEHRVAQRPATPAPPTVSGRPGKGEGGSAGCSAPLDRNKDGRQDGLAVDENCDGKAEYMLIDNNGDGRLDTLIGDRDGDGRTDLQATDENGDGKADIWVLDENGDGEPDVMGRDVDGDGRPDVYRKVAG